MANFDFSHVNLKDPMDKTNHDLWKLLMDDSAKLTILYSRLSEAYFKMYG